MSSLRQIHANRLNARLSTGPVTEEGKRKSRQNAVRHGLTAETVIGALEDAEDYAAFEMAVTSDYDAQTVVERELVLRLASLLWRLRRATAIETGLFEIQVRHLLDFRQDGKASGNRHSLSDELYWKVGDAANSTPTNANEDFESDVQCRRSSLTDSSACSGDMTLSFIRLTNLPTCPLDRLSRYEAALWRQACQLLFSLQHLNLRKPWQKLRVGR